MKHGEMLERMEHDLALAHHYEDVPIRLTKIVYAWVTITKRRLEALEAKSAQRDNA